MFFGECLCLLPVLIRVTYQTYFKSTTLNSSKTTRAQNQSLDSEPLLSRTDHDRPDTSTRIRQAEESEVGSTTAAATATGNSSASPTTTTTATSKPIDASQARGRSRVKRQKSTTRVRKNKNLTGKAIFLFFTPAFCDICGTTLMNVGLLFTPVSIYQ